MADADNNKLLQELDALSQTLYQAHTARRTASLALPRSSDAVQVNPDDPSVPTETVAIDQRRRPRRMSMSPFRSRSKLDSTTDNPPSTKSRPQPAIKVYATPDEEKKGLWSWKPLRALSHVSMNRLTILFSVEVVAIESLPASMNGLRLSVTVRRKETKDGAVQTMPARVVQGVADFEETLFIRSHVYCTGGGSSRKALKFEPRPSSSSPRP
ncbi:hypothetical protein HPP92_009780 [Vanilla planifolia]|uniref:C2 NT-type domain-containing protein n=1 Tax=Vanilla planifolia TaxID=51239 RepID=A0A835R8S1_VANPL|nr:hypothetical protein HPP92_009780 [Vanilla planifolia]